MSELACQDSLRTTQIRLGVVLSILSAFLFIAPTWANELKIIHMYIGQGDATLILGPPDASGNRVSVLVDAGDIPMGGDLDGGHIVGAVLQKNNIKKLDYFIVTHYDADHIGGSITGELGTHGRSFILGVDQEPGSPGDDDGDGQADWLGPDFRTHPDPDELGTGDDIKVDHFVDRGDANPPSSATYRKYQTIASSMGARNSITSGNDVNSFEIDLGGGAKMLALAANGFVRDRTVRVDNVNTENERSLCFLLRYGKFDYLIGGDLIGRQYGSEDAAVERAVGEWIQGNSINVDVLHVNHHGGNNASETDFLEMVHPQIAVISLGNGNPHHHPHRDVLERLVNAGVYRIYQTGWGTTQDDIPGTVRQRQAIFQGDVFIVTDGSWYEISTMRRFLTDAD